MPDQLASCLAGLCSFDTCGLYGVRAVVFCRRCDRQQSVFAHAQPAAGCATGTGRQCSDSGRAGAAVCAATRTGAQGTAVALRAYGAGAAASGAVEHVGEHLDWV